MVRHCHEDALTEAEFDDLVDALGELQEPYRSEAELVLVAGGRLGLRAGEIAHLSD